MTAGSMTDEWRELTQPSDALIDARLQLHWAAQLLSWFGSTLVPPQEDDSHSNLGWGGSAGVLVTHPSRDPELRATLRIESFSVAVQGAPGEIAGQTLDGSTLDQVAAWMERVTTDAAGRSVQLQRRDYDMPGHAVADGAAFSRPDDRLLAELAAWFNNGFLALEQAVRDTPDAEPVRCWPHHFDVGSLIPLDPDAGKSVGLGLSPGDGNYAHPYWYVNPYPNPPADGLPALPGGAHWHTSGWIGAVLTADATAAGSGADQASRVAEYLSASIAACRALLGY